MEHLNELIRIQERETGLKILWKKVGIQTSCSCGFDSAHTLHCNRFCAAVKRDPQALTLCAKHDNEELGDIAETNGCEPFLTTCHAGVSELVIPLSIRGKCREVILIGIFRLPGTVCPDPALRNMFARLPRRTPGELRKIRLFWTHLAPVLLEHRLRIEEELLTRQIRDSRVAGVIRRIRQDFAQNLTLARLSREACLSPSRLIHLFRAETGMSISAYLKQCRIEAAKGLLRSTDLPMLELMDQCGFHDQSRFGKFFRESTGYTPLSYRKTYREDPKV